MLCGVFLCFSSLLFATQTTSSSEQPKDTFQSLSETASAARRAGNSAEAVRDYIQALALNPEWAEGWWDLGVTQYEANQYSEAVASLHNLTRLAPNTGVGWTMLGLSEFETKDYDDSLASLEKGKTLGGSDDPDIARVSNYHLALLLIRSAQFDRATALLKSAFGESPSPQVKVALGLALLRVPLLPSEVDPSQDALVHAAGDAAASADSAAFATLIQQYPATPWLHYIYGTALAASGKSQEALQQQKLETTISPTNALPWVQISKLQSRLKKPSQALSAAQRAISLEPQSPAAHDALANALSAAGKTQQAQVQRREAARLSKAPPLRDPKMVSRYEVRAANAPQNSAAWTAAMQDYSAGNYPQALAELKGWVERNDDDGTAWAVMGLSEFALKDYENARIHLQRGINLGLKGSPEALQLASYRLALLLILDGQFDDASALLKPVADHPPLAQVELALGLALLRSPHLPEDLDPQHRELAQSAGAIVELLFASRYSDAFPAFEKLIAANPNTPWLHYAYGDALVDFSQYDKAKVQMQAESKLSPESALPWIRLASINLRLQKPDDAMNAARAAVALDKNSAEAHYQLGRAWLEEGDVRNSIAELSRANDLKPNNPEIHFALARAYTKANQPGKAAAERAAFIQLKTAADQKTNTSGGQSILQPNAQ